MVYTQKITFSGYPMTEQFLQRYFTNQLTPEEVQQVLDWFDTEAGQTYLTQRLDTELGRADWHAPPHAPSPDADLLLTALRQRMRPFRNVPVGDLVEKSTPFRRRWYAQSLRWAAVLVGALLLATAAFYGYQQLYPAELIGQTAYGKTTTLTLPDGSTVSLNGNSRLRYAQRWRDGQTRNVWLDGEGFFRVTHQPNHERFVVHLPNKLNIEVLGTQFNVMARHSRAKVVLNNGKIRLDVSEKSNGQLVMVPGDMVYADVQKRIYYRKRVDPALQSSWQQGKLHFEGTTLLEVAQMLEETYGVSVVITDAGLRQQKLSGTIPNNNIQTILSGLSTLFDLRITQHKNRIIIQQP